MGGAAASDGGMSVKSVSADWMLHRRTSADALPRSTSTVLDSWCHIFCRTGAMLQKFGFYSGSARLF